MKKSVFKIRFVVLFVMFFSAITCNNFFAQTAKTSYSEPNALTKKEVKEGWILLFDGKTFNGWHGYNTKGIPDCWKVEDGIMKMTSENGKEGKESLDVITDKIYKSFELMLEFKLTKGANSGIIYHVAEDLKYKYPYENGC